MGESGAAAWAKVVDEKGVGQWARILRSGADVEARVTLGQPGRQHEPGVLVSGPTQDFLGIA